MPYPALQEKSKSPKRRSPKKGGKSEKNQMVDKLKGINQKLRRRLKDLNLIVEKAIDRTDTKRILVKNRPRVNAEHTIQVREQEIINAQKQIVSYQKEMQQLQDKIESLQGVDNMLSTEHAVVESKEMTHKLTRKIKDLEKVNKDQGLALQKITDGDEYQYKIRNLVDEIRMWKDKCRTIDDQGVKQENTLELQKERMQKLQKDNDKLEKKIDELQKKHGLEPEKPKGAVKKGDVEKMMDDRDKMKKKYKQLLIKNKKEIQTKEEE